MDVDEDINWNQSICHKDGESHDYQPLTQITETSWLTLTNTTLVRKDHVYDKLQSYFKGESRGCYHCNCYQWYTHKQKLERLKRKRKRELQIKKFGEQVGFRHPKNRSKSEIIYSELLPLGQIIEGFGNQQISEESDIDF